MRRPGIGTYLIGNPISALALFALTVWITWRWYNGDAPGIAAIILGFVTMSAFDANGKLNDYRHWQREWNAMGGQAPRPGALTRFVGSRTVKVLFGVPLWCAFAYGALHVKPHSDEEVAAGLFWIGSLVIVAVAIYRFIARRRASRPKSNIRDVPVTPCVAIPRQSPSVAEALSALPSYCRPLFQRTKQTNALRI